MTVNSSALRIAEFNPLIRPYLLLNVAFLMAITIIGLPLAVVWLLGPGQWWASHYFKRLRCELTDTELRFRKGILFQVEKTIPLENIQDVTFTEGPLLRHFNLTVLKFETAGQSQGGAHDMKLVGIIDADDFRNDILARRQALRRAQARGGAEARPAAADNEQLQLLRGIHQRLEDIAALLRSGKAP
jgi:putative membrane protein